MSQRQQLPLRGECYLRPSLDCKIYSKLRKSILFMQQREFSCEYNEMIYQFDTISDKYSQIPSIEYPTIVNQAYDHKFVAFDNKNDILYLVSGNYQHDMLEQWDLKNNQVTAMNVSQLKFAYELQTNLVATYVECKDELHVITFDENRSAIHYKYKYNIDNNQLDFVQLSEIKNITKTQFVTHHYIKFMYIPCLHSLVLVIPARNIFQCDLNTGKYKWKRFRFPAADVKKSYAVLQYEHILFASGSGSPGARGIWCFDLFYVKIYKSELQIRIGSAAINTNDGYFHTFGFCGPAGCSNVRKFSHISAHYKSQITEILPQELKVFYKQRNEKLISGFARRQKLSSYPPVIFIQIINNYYNLFQ
eukprot:415170_1